MKENTPTLKEWHRLYQAAGRIKEIAPWEWMTEMEVFGVQDPETGEIGFVSVMGMLGEHYSIALYLGPKGLYGLWALEEQGPSGSPEQLLNVPQLQASWEDRNTLHDQDRQIIKQLGLKFRGRNAWPMFRSYRPGFFPWFLEVEEARFLACALEQVPDVVLRVREDPSLLEPPGEESYLVRVSRQQREDLVWEDRVMRVPPPEAPSIWIEVENQSLQALKRIRRTIPGLEIDLFIFPGPIGERGTRPHYCYLLMMVEPQSGFLLANDLLMPDPSLEAMWGSVPMNVAKALIRFQALPRKVVVRPPLLQDLLEPLAEEIGFELTQSDDLPSLDEAKEFLLSRFI